MPTGTANLGRISGPLLKENLTRTSDLAFETDLLYIGHTNNKIGIRTDAPSKELTADIKYAKLPIMFSLNF